MAACGRSSSATTSMLVRLRVLGAGEELLLVSEKGVIVRAPVPMRFRSSRALHDRGEAVQRLDKGDRLLGSRSRSARSGAGGRRRRQQQPTPPQRTTDLDPRSGCAGAGRWSGRPRHRVGAGSLHGVAVDGHRTCNQRRLPGRTPTASGQRSRSASACEQPLAPSPSDTVSYCEHVGQRGSGSGRRTTASTTACSTRAAAATPLAGGRRW